MQSLKDHVAKENLKTIGFAEKNEMEAKIRSYLNSGHLDSRRKDGGDGFGCLIGDLTYSGALSDLQ